MVSIFAIFTNLTFGKNLNIDKINMPSVILIKLLFKISVKQKHNKYNKKEKNYIIG